MHIEKIDEHLIWTSQGYGNSAAIDLGGKILVIDSMLNFEYAKEWKKHIEKNFDSKCSGLVLTHHHGDHTFGNQIFSDLPIISSVEVRKIMMDWQEHVWTPENLKEWEEASPEGKKYGIQGLQITLPNVCFEKSLSIYAERTAEIIQADGHTTGSSYLWEPETRTIIAGDLIFNQQFPFGGDETCNIIQWQRAIEDLMSLKPRTVISGHGPTATIKNLEEINNFLLKSINFIKKRLADGISPEELSKDPDFPDYYSENLEERKEVTIESWGEFMEQFRSSGE